MNLIQKPTVVIMSAFRAGHEDNAVKHRDLQDDLQHLGLLHKEVVGFYKGVHEMSFVVTVESSSQIARLISLAALYGQESVLVVQADTRKAYLRFTDGGTEALGTLRWVPAHVAADADAWTCDPRTGQYYVAA